MAGVLARAVSGGLGAVRPRVVWLAWPPQAGVLGRGHSRNAIRHVRHVCHCAQACVQESVC